MERVNPNARRDVYGSRINRDYSPVLAYTVPILSVLIASLIPVLPIASAMPYMPPLGFLALLAWFIIRPDLFPVWVGFPLGMFDDLFSGQPFGSAILLWSVTIIMLDIIMVRFPWRSFVQDWLTVAMITLVYLPAAVLLSGGIPSIPGLLMLIPQYLLSIILFPFIARQVARLDRFRLMRVKVIG